VFVHGLSDQARSFALVGALLAEHFRCIAYDLPTGQGDGARLHRYTHADLVADLFALLDHLGVRQSYILGSSFGATIALEALRGRPERLPRAILQGGFACRPLAPAEWLLARFVRHRRGPMRDLPWREAIAHIVDYATFASHPPAVWRFFLECSGANPVAAVAQRAALLHRVDLRPVLAEIRQPVLLVCGDGDTLVKQSCEEVLLKGLPNARRVELSACGHYPHYTHPELLAEVVRRFMTPPGAG
jgi:pimeloyl-ACP methyl ester carboxylesterase